MSNLGPIANAKGRIDIQIRDLDRTVIGNPTHNLVRLGLSLASAARGSDLPGVATALMIEKMIEGYEQAFTAAETGIAQEAAKPEAVKIALRSALRRKWRHLARERIKNTKPHIPLGSRFWPLARPKTAHPARKESKHAGPSLGPRRRTHHCELTCIQQARYSHFERNTFRNGLLFYG